MGGVELLAQARAIGLEVTEQGGLLKVRGPLEHEALAQRLLAAKAEVLTVLREESHLMMSPAAPCRNCGGRAFWRRVHGHWLCARCHPAPCPEAVAEESHVTDPLSAVHGSWPLSDDVAAGPRQHGWESIARVDFPADREDPVPPACAVIPARRAKEANKAKEAATVKQEASDVA